MQSAQPSDEPGLSDWPLNRTYLSAVINYVSFRLFAICSGVGDASATVLLSDKEVCEVDPVWKTPKKWKNLRLARDLKQRVLRACGGSSLFLEASGGFFAAEPLEVLTFKKSYPQMLLDQHLRYGWELLQYNLSDSNENWFLANRICMVDPKLSGQLLAEDHDRPELLQAALERLRSENKLLFVPVWGHSPNHWTLLVLQREDLSENFCVKYLDSLSEKHEECSVNASRLLSLLVPTEVLPERSLSGTQTSDECGFWVLANMLSICSGLLLEGPCARGSRGKLVLELMFELKGWLQQLSGEQKKLEKELLAKEKDLEKTLKANRLRMEKLAGKSGKDSDSAVKLQDLAKQLLSLNKEPDASDLSAETSLASSWSV